jgi:hypothetical protein
MRRGNERYVVASCVSELELRFSSFCGSKLLGTGVLLPENFTAWTYASTVSKAIRRMVEPNRGWGLTVGKCISGVR